MRGGGRKNRYIIQVTKQINRRAERRNRAFRLLSFQYSSSQAGCFTGQGKEAGGRQLEEVQERERKGRVRAGRGPEAESCPRDSYVAVLTPSAQNLIYVRQVIREGTPDNTTDVTL